MSFTNTRLPHPVAVPKGTVRVSPKRARALALALATANHTWWERPGALPDDPGSLQAAVEAADRLQAEGVWASDGDPKFWRPRATIDERGVFVWVPWHPHRWGRTIEISPDGRISWTAGEGSSPMGAGAGSTFIGAALCAAAGLDNLRGLVALRDLR